MNQPPKNILFVCAQNRIRSYTAEVMFADSNCYQIRSRGVARDARASLTEDDLDWADVVFVMEKNHRNRMIKKFRDKARNKRIVCLYIDDIYDPMEASLIAELRFKLAPYLEIPEEMGDIPPCPD